MKKVIWIVLIIALAFPMWMVSAQEPNTKEDNACYEGGSMAGKCDTPWEWICGYYLAHWESAGGGFNPNNNLVDWCKSLLLPEPVVIQESSTTAARAVDDSYSVGCEPFFSVGTPGVLANDIGGRIQAISSSTAGNPDLIINMSVDGSFDASFTEPGIFTFTYIITGGSSATVTLNNLCS